MIKFFPLPGQAQTSTLAPLHFTSILSFCVHNVSLSLFALGKTRCFLSFIRACCNTPLTGRAYYGHFSCKEQPFLDFLFLADRPARCTPMILIHHYSADTCCALAAIAKASLSELTLHHPTGPTHPVGPSHSCPLGSSFSLWTAALSRRFLFYLRRPPTRPLGPKTKAASNRHTPTAVSARLSSPLCVFACSQIPFLFGNEENDQ